MQIDFSCPQVMGIINLSQDSYSTIGRCKSTAQALERAHQIVEEGGRIIDIGAEATNPKQDDPTLPLQQELDRLIPVVEAVANKVDAVISVDTSKPEVIRAAVAVGAHVINDTRALCLEGALQTVKELNVPVCLMHMRFPYGQTTPPSYDYPEGIVPTVFNFLKERVAVCLNSGISHSNLLIDPGIGFGSFGKSTKQNTTILNNLEVFKTLNLPIVVGVSRKTFIGDLLDLPVADRLAGSLAATTVAWMHGATIIRTHDVKATVDTLKIVEAIQEPA